MEPGRQMRFQPMNARPPQPASFMHQRPISVPVRPKPALQWIATAPQIAGSKATLPEKDTLRTSTLRALSHFLKTRICERLDFLQRILTTPSRRDWGYHSCIQGISFMHSNSFENMKSKLCMQTKSFKNWNATLITNTERYRSR